MAALYCHECGGLLELDSDGSYWCSNCQNWTKIPWGMKILYRDPNAYLYYSTDPGITIHAVDRKEDEKD